MSSQDGAAADLDDGVPRARQIFEEWQIGDLTLKNRIVKAATGDTGDFDELLETSVRLAQNEVALITIAYIAVDERDKTFDHQLGINVENLAEWRRLTAAVQRAGGRISAQLHHPGLFCMAREARPAGPSLGWLPSGSWKLPRVLSLADLEGLRLRYATAAYLCKEAGFDAIELHCGHGYLLSQFLTPLLNRRSDGYGGSVGGRARFPAEVLAAVKRASGLPVLVKMNLEDGISQAGLPLGLGLDDAITTARVLVAAGADAIVPSFGYTSLNGFGMLRGNVPLAKMVENMSGGTAWLLRLFGKVLVPKIEYTSLFLHGPAKKMLAALRSGSPSVKVLYVGGADSLRSIEEVLGDSFDGVQLARPLLREPFFVRRIKRTVAARARADPGDAANFDVESKCIRCNHCVLASLNPKIKPGCVFLKPTELDIEEVPNARM